MTSLISTRTITSAQEVQSALASRSRIRAALGLGEE